ncbi:hypothetical protein [Streptomyces sp. NPDC056399]|uniref:hypothetical protein n=1 Tax=Streptomyces sp. NPDC056399 TaxID=3345807 RepID=UPI0035DC8E6A
MTWASGWSGRSSRPPGRSFCPSSSGWPSWASSRWRSALPPQQRLAQRGGPSKAQQAFQRGLAALTQYVVREGRLPARSVIEVLPDGTEHRTGIWYGNLKARRDKLTEEQLAALRELEVH